MDINKILSEQLNLNALNPFATTNVEGVNDNAENSEMSVNPDVAEVSDALNVQDEDVTLNFNNIDLAKLNKSAKNINSMMNFMSNQVQNQENKEKQIEEEIVKKQEEYQKLAEDIQEKQEEYESLVKQAESEQDQSIAAQATTLGEEINSMVSNLESIKTSIDNLETNLKTQENLTSTLKQTSQTISKVQTQISKEVAQANAVSQAQAINQVSATDAVKNVGETTQLQETFVVAARPKITRKSVDEYITDLQNKFDKVWEQCGSGEEVEKYVKNNLIEFTDLDGDGNISPIDYLILLKYKDHIKTPEMKKLQTEKGINYQTSISSTVHYAIMGNSKGYMMSLDDLEYFYENGGKSLGATNGVNWGSYDSVHRKELSLNSTNVDYVDIAKTENWQERLNALNEKYGLDKHYFDKKIEYVQELSDYIKTNPQNANYASTAIAYQKVVAKYNKRLEEAENIDWFQKAQEEREKADALYDEYKKTLKQEYAEYKSKEKFLGIKPEYLHTFDEYCMIEAYGDLLDSSPGCLFVKFNGTIAAELKKAYIGKSPSELSHNAYLDISANSQVSGEDLAMFSTEIDLNGDGNVSNEEKSYLQNTQKSLNTKVWNIIRGKSAYNISTVEDVISYYTNVDVQAKYDGLNDKLQSLKDNIECRVEWHNKRYTKPITVEDQVVLGQRAANPVNAVILGSPAHSICYTGYLDGTVEIEDYLAKTRDANIFELEELWIKGFEILEPKNTYFHYINSADLSKEELQNILDKIKSASQKAQTELVEVVNAIEQKLAGM